jgi:TP901 family phage tail tape measure protein
VTDRSIFVRLGAIASGLKSGFKDASAAAKQTATDIEAAGRKSEQAVEKTAAKVPLIQRALNGLSSASAATSKWVTKNRDEIDKLASAGLVAGGLMAAGAAIAAKKYADFDEAMSHVAATGSDARANLGALREEAIKLGADTVFSAQEAAQGIEAMEKAGVSAKDILGGGLQGSLSLAAAGELSVGDAAEVAATALVQFGLSGTQMNHVADLLAAGAGKAQGEVSDLALALKYVGPVASGMGVSIEETVGALAAFASQGILADQAGTSLRGVLAALTSPSSQAAGEIERLGITLYDSNGKFLGLANVAGQLQKAYSGVTDQAKDASLGILFGNQQVTAARVLFDQGAKGIQDWTDKANDAGYAATAAATRMDNLKGDVERLSGSIDSALIQSGTGINTLLRNTVQSAESIVDAVGQIPPGILGVVTALAGSGGLGVLGVSALGKLLVGINDAKLALVSLTGSAKAAGLAAGALGAVVGIGALAISKWASDVATARANADDFAATLVVINGKIAFSMATVSSINDKLANTKTMFGFGPTLLDLMNKVGISAADAQGFLTDEAEAVDRVNAAIDIYTKQHWLDASMTTTPLLKALTDLKGSMSDAERTTLQKAQADKEAGSAADSNATAQKTITAYLTDQTDALGNATTLLKDYETALWNAATAALKLSGSEIGFRQAVADANKGINDKGHKGKGVDTHTQVGRDNQSDLNQIVTSGKTRINDILETEGKGKKAVAAMKELRESFIAAATAATGSKARAVEMADALKLFPKNVDTELTLKDQDAQAELGTFKELLTGLPKETQARIIADYNDKGAKAAYDDLNSLDGATADAWVNSLLDQKGIKGWENWSPAKKRAAIQPYLTDSEINLKVKVTMRNQPKDAAEGGLFARSALVSAGLGLVQEFADGGFPAIGSQQSQIQRTRPGGIRWAEDTTADWEGFVSGHPGKIHRSRAITSEIARRLGGVASFAEGGFAGDPALARLIASGRASALGTTHVTNINLNGDTYYPQSEPKSVETNRKLGYAAAVGRY